LPDDVEALIRYRQERAEAAWIDASLLLGHGSLESIVNRLYYVAFYGVSALLLTENLSSSRHTGIRSLFNRQFVNAGRISKNAGRTFNDLFERRQSADYADFIQFQTADVGLWIADCRTLLNEINEVIEQGQMERD
jgi:uncharacterized protein